MRNANFQRVEQSIHHFLLWLPKAAVASAIAIATLAIGAAKIWPEAKTYISIWSNGILRFVKWRWFPLLISFVIILWSAGFFLTLPRNDDEVGTEILAVSEFNASITGANIFVAGENLTGMALDLRVWNAGKPAIVTNWVLQVSNPRYPTMPSQLKAIAPLLTLNGPDHNVLKESDDLSRMGNQLIDDNPVSGSLLFLVKAPKSEVMDQETIIKLTVEDNQNRSFVFEKKMSDCF